MCHPAVAAAASAASAGLSIAGSLSKNAQAGQTFVETGYNTNVALGQTYNSIQAKQKQAGDQAAAQSFDVLKQMTLAKGKAVAAAGEAGVGGVSFSNVLADMEAKQAGAKGNIAYNYATSVQAGEDEKAASEAKAKSVIAATPRPNPMAAMAEVGGAAAGAGLKIYEIGDKAKWWDKLFGAGTAIGGASS